MAALSSNPDVEMIQGLGREFIDALASLPFQSRRCALLDFPNHNNVGDNAIWAGERVGLRQAGFHVEYVSDIYSYRAAALRSRLKPGDPVFLHGGGNLGTLWPAHQEFRESILHDLRDYPVIQMPQSVYFEDRLRLNAYCRIVAEHPDARVWVRDASSAETLGSLGSRIRVMPDAAFALGLLPRPCDPSVDVFCLLREDHEARFDPFEFQGVEIGDWLLGEPGRPWMRSVHRATVRLRTSLNRLVAASDLTVELTDQWRASVFDELCCMRIQRGLRTIARARVVITDRLHAHILCMLVGIPHVCLDNVYGKIAKYHQSFTSKSLTTVLASTPVEAIGEARRLLQFSF